MKKNAGTSFTTEIKVLLWVGSIGSVMVIGLYYFPREYPELIETYALFGDPAMDLHSFYITHLPLILRSP